MKLIKTPIEQRIYLHAEGIVYASNPAIDCHLLPRVLRCQLMIISLPSDP